MKQEPATITALPHNGSRSSHKDKDNNRVCASVPLQTTAGAQHTQHICASALRITWNLIGRLNHYKKQGSYGPTYCIQTAAHYPTNPRRGGKVEYIPPFTFARKATKRVRSDTVSSGSRVAIPPASFARPSARSGADAHRRATMESTGLPLPSFVPLVSASVGGGSSPASSSAGSSLASGEKDAGFSSEEACLSGEWGESMFLLLQAVVIALAI